MGIAAGLFEGAALGSAIGYVAGGSAECVEECARLDVGEDGIAVMEDAQRTGRRVGLLTGAVCGGFGGL